MKKCTIFSVLLLLAALLCACKSLENELEYIGSVVTQAEPSYIYETGETVQFLDGSDQSPLAAMVVKNTTVVEDDPLQFHSYGSIPAGTDAIIQINYTCEGYDIGTSFLHVYDEQGVEATHVYSGTGIYTAYNKALFAVQTEGSYVDLHIVLKEDSDQAVVRLYYDVGEIEEDPTIVKRLNEAFFLLLILLIILMRSYFKTAKNNTVYKKEIEALQISNAAGQASTPEKAAPVVPAMEESEVAQ